jgi:trk system potassium uptake protein
LKRNHKIRKIVIIGAGTVGRHIANLLQRETVDVSVIDNNLTALNEVAESYDVLTIHGNGANPEVQNRAGVPDAQLVLALTDSCEVNLLAAFVARKLGALKTVVRTRAPWSQNTNFVDFRKDLGIDLLLNPEQLTAIEIGKYLDNPEALALTNFAQGKVQMRQFIIDSRSPFCGKALHECRGQIPPGVLVATRVRDHEVVIPRGENDLQEGDKITIIGLPEKISEAQRLFHAPRERLRQVTIAGGGNSGYFLAHTLENKNFDIRLIESDHERCEYLSERLHRTRIIRGDVTHREFMQEERIGRSDVFIAVTGEDEDNLMACLMAKELGVDQSVAQINRPDYASLVEHMGVNMAISPRHVMANHIMALVIGGRVKQVAIMEEGRVEVIESIARHGTPLVGRPLSQVDQDLPDGVLICAIVSDGRVRVPGGDDTIIPGDTVIVAGFSEKMDEIESMFREK